MRSALQSIFRYNWREELGDHANAQRVFVTRDEAGLLLCTWPRGGRPAIPFVYSDEVWSGIEYQVAGHMAWEGLITEALVICRGIHDRYHPSNHNPWNEVECGDHYARALASWGVYLALAGFEYHGPRGHLGFAPKITPKAFKAAFTWAEGWGAFEQSRASNTQTNRITLKWGQLRAKTCAFVLPGNPAAVNTEVRAAGNLIPAKAHVAGGRILVTLDSETTLREGDTLECAFAW